MKRRKQPGVTQETPHRDAEWYTSVFTAEEQAVIKRWLETTTDTLNTEVAVLRVLIQRVMEHLGVNDPAQALPLVRQAVDALCRTLRTQRVLKGEANDSLKDALQIALRDMKEKKK